MDTLSRNHLDSLFIFPPGGENANNYFFYHTGSAYIIAYLRQNGFTSEQFIWNDLVNLENCVNRILKYRARVIGFTVYNTNFLTSVLIAEQLKMISPETIIVFGGPTATTYTDYILDKYSSVDVCFRNESEEIFLQFVAQLSDNNFDLSRIDLRKIKGISYRKENKVHNNPESNILVDNFRVTDYLDKYPSPYLSGVIPGPASFNIGLLTARGCNQNCVYCNCAVLSKRRFTTHSVDRVINEIDFISGYSGGNQILNFFDDAFTLIPQRAKTICKAIIENRIKISLSCITRCDCVDEELLDLMKEAGFVSLGFALESANPGTLRKIGKVHVAEDVPSDGLEKETIFIEKLGKVTAYAKKIGIKNIFTSIMAGLPDETIEEANRTVETIDQNADIEFYTHNFLTVYKGTPLEATYPRYGYKVEYFDNNPIFSRTIYPNEIVKKVNISPKSQIHKAQKTNNINALKVLSLVPENSYDNGWFKNIILLSDMADRNFIEWLRKILAINGTIFQIYSDKDALLNHSMKNYEKFIKYLSPSLNIQNYCLDKENALSKLKSYSSARMNLGNKEYGISICDFNFIRSNLNNPETNFIMTLCRESDADDAISAYEHFCGLRNEKNLFGYLINKKPYPYFANLCKWTKNLSNCKKRNTLLVNDKSEIRLCWFGREIGKVGQSYTEIIQNIELYLNETTERRGCESCTAKDNCCRCLTPFPVSDAEYCTMRKSNDITEVAELILSFDVFKQLI
jgi:radical SAM superfamily enzyme YgiQ (UPF0313 family)